MRYQRKPYGTLPLLFLLMKSFCLRLPSIAHQTNTTTRARSMATEERIAVIHFNAVSSLRSANSELHKERRALATTLDKGRAALSWRTPKGLRGKTRKPHLQGVLCWCNVLVSDLCASAYSDPLCLSLVDKLFRINQLDNLRPISQDFSRPKKRFPLKRADCLGLAESLVLLRIIKRSSEERRTLNCWAHPHRKTSPWQFGGMKRRKTLAHDFWITLQRPCTEKCALATPVDGNEMTAHSTFLILYNPKFSSKMLRWLRKAAQKSLVFVGFHLSFFPFLDKELRDIIRIGWHRIRNEENFQKRSASLLKILLIWLQIINEPSSYMSIRENFGKSKFLKRWDFKEARLNAARNIAHVMNPNLLD